MCLIVFALDQHPDWPLVLLANRDEFYRRPSQPLAPWPDAPILAGRDLEAGGTWLGLSRQGRFAAVTNFRDGRAAAREGRSRGQLVTDFLLGAQPAAAFQPDRAVRSGYNLLWADRSGFYYASNRDGGSRQLGAGLYALSNAVLDTPWPKTERARRRLAQALEGLEPGIELDPTPWLALLADPTPAADAELPSTGVALAWERTLSSCFIRAEGYGTRATTLLMQHRSGAIRLVEQRFDAEGTRGRSDYLLQGPALRGA